MNEMKKRTEHFHEDNALSEEATAWFLRLRNDEVSAGDFARWREWVNTSPANTEAFDRDLEFWKRSEALEDLPWPSDDELDSDNYDGSEDLLLPQSQNKRRGKQSRLRTFAQIAAMLLLVASVGLLAAPRFRLPQTQMPVLYETNVAEHQFMPG